ncbi:MAG: hypothetical protein ACYDB9_08345 [Gammaproteobacteria bacterium]
MFADDGTGWTICVLIPKRSKVSMNKSIGNVAIFLFLVLGVAGCGGGGSSPPVATCSSAGETNVNAGGSSGGNYGVFLGGTFPSMNFNNISENFNGNSIEDVGPGVCLESITSMSGGTSVVSMVPGDSYIGYLYGFGYDGNTPAYVRFSVNSYYGGVVNISYLPGE